MGIGYAIKQLRRAKGMSQKQLSIASGLAQPSISYLEKVDPEYSRGATELAKALGVSEEELLALASVPRVTIESKSNPILPLEITRRNSGCSLTVEPIPNTSQSQHTFRDDLVFVREYRVEFSAGDGAIFDYTEVEEGTPKAYSLNFFHSLRVNPNKCKRFKVSGNSMEPLLYDGDSILVVEEPVGTPIRDGQVYIVRYDNELKVKRVSKNMDGSVTLRSVNSAQYADFTVPAEDVGTRFTILGKVIEKCGTGGLAG